MHLHTLIQLYLLFVKIYIKRLETHKSVNKKIILKKQSGRKKCK